MRRRVVAIAAVLALVTGSAFAADPPVVTIESAPEGNNVTDSTPEFTFSANENATFECSVDNAPLAACTSPFVAGPLESGPHQFAVVAISTATGMRSGSVSHEWTSVSPLTTPIVRLTTPIKRTLKRSSLRMLSGSAESPTGVTRVQVALAIGEANKNFFPPRCRFFDLETGQPAPQICVVPKYFTASGTTTWQFRVPAAVRRKLPAGRYRLTVRAFNPYQQASQRNFKLTLR